MHKSEMTVYVVRAYIGSPKLRASLAISEEFVDGKTASPWLCGWRRGKAAAKEFARVCTLITSSKALRVSETASMS